MQNYYRWRREQEEARRAKRVNRWFTILAVIATAGAVICIAAALSGGIEPGALPSAPPAWVVP